MAERGTDIDLSTRGKVVLCRPLGGLNDALCQVEKCVQYAREHNRELVIDLSVNPLVESVFENLRLQIDSVTVDVLSQCQGVIGEPVSVRPPEVAGRLSTYQAVQSPGESHNDRFDGESGALLSFDFEASHPESLVLHHSSGGGSHSANLLPYIHLIEPTQLRINSVLSSLPSVYFSAHVRHTDYQTPYRLFLRRVARLANGIPTVVCSDSNHVLAWVEKNGPRLGLLSLGMLARNNGQPIHNRAQAENAQSMSENAIRVLADIVMVRKSEKFFYTNRLPHKFVELWRERRLSGFTGLLATLIDAPGGILGVERSEARTCEGRRAHLVALPGWQFYSVALFHLTRKSWRGRPRLGRFLRRLGRRLVAQRPALK